MNYLIPVSQNYPAAIVTPPETLTDRIVAQSAQYQFPICNSRDFNLDNAYGLVYQNLEENFQKSLFLNMFFYQNSCLIASSLPYFGNYEGNIVLNTGDNIIADDASIQSFLNEGPRCQSILARKQNEIYTAYQNAADNKEKINATTSSQNTNIANSQNACPVTEEENMSIRFLQIKLQVINMIIFLTSSLKGLLPEFMIRFIRPQTTANRILKCVPPLIQTIKSEILMQILRQKKELFFADNQENLQTYVKKRLVEIGLLTCWSQHVRQTNTPLTKIKKYIIPSEHLAYLFSAIYKITDGKISSLNNLCILIAKIMLGRQILKNELGINPTLTVIKTANFTFLNQFFSAISDFTHPRSPRGKSSTYYNIVQQEKDLLAYHEGHFKMIPNLAPIRQTQIFSHKSLNDLTDSGKIGQLIEDDIDGNLFNVSCGNLNNVNFNYLNKFITGTPIKSVSCFLGEQSFSSNAKLIHLCYPEKDITTSLRFVKVPFECIELGMNVPKECGLFEKGEGFRLEEISWFWIFASIKGLKLIANSKSEKENNATNPFGEFMNLAIENAPYSEKNTDEYHKYAVPFKTLSIMYNSFLKIVHKIENANIEVNATFLKENGFGFLPTKDGKNAAAFDDLISKHYNSSDLVGKSSGGQHITGFTIKDKEELLATFHEIASSKTDYSLSYNDFVNLLLCETKAMFDLDIDTSNPAILPPLLK